MRFDVVTLFPEMLAVLTAFGVSRRAHENGAWQLQCWDPRAYATDLHRTVDDRPFGGGPGMVLMAEPLALCVESARAAQAAAGYARSRVVVLSASGVPLRDARVRQWAAAGQEGADEAVGNGTGADGAGGADGADGAGGGRQGLILVCGRYEGIDQRFIDACADEEVSIGDFILSGGEIAAMALIDAVVRHVPGTMKAQSAQEESFATGLLDVPHYTRPETWRGRAVPAVLLSGHHAQIERWRQEQARARTQAVRPELLPGAGTHGAT